MTDFATFKSGGVTYPVTSPGTNTFLRDADPALFYLLEFYASVISTHVGTRLLAEAAAAGASQVAAAVASTIPFDPEPYLTTDALQFPLLAAYRMNTTVRYLGHRKQLQHQLEVVYVLPPLRPSEAERLMPALHAVHAILDNRTELGFDPAYTPTAPTGTAGEVAWAAARAGLARVEVLGARHGGYRPTEDLFFPALMLNVNAEERHEEIPSAFQTFNGADASVDLATADGLQVTDFVQGATQPPPTVVSCSPNTGTKQGGTPVTVTTTGAAVGARLLFGGADASNVVVVSPTQVTCVTPAHDAQPTYAAGVQIINPDGQAYTLTTGFTFTSP